MPFRHYEVSDVLLFVVHCSLEQSERAESPTVAEGYTLSVAFACLMEIVKSLDTLVQGEQCTTEVGWIEPATETNKNSTGVGTETIGAAAHKGKE